MSETNQKLRNVKALWRQIDSLIIQLEDSKNLNRKLKAKLILSNSVQNSLSKRCKALEVMKQ